MSFKIVNYKDLSSYTNQFKQINFTAEPGKLYKFVKRSELIELAAQNMHVRPEEMNKIAPEFVASKEQYVTRKELVDLFAHIFLYCGFTSLEEVRKAPRRKSIESLLDRTGPSSCIALNSSKMSYMTVKKEACALLDREESISPYAPKTEACQITIARSLKPVSINETEVI